MLYNRLTLLLTTILSLFITKIEARRKLSATSLVTCMENSQISPTYFNVTFNPDDNSLRYALSLTTEISGNVIAHVQVYAYGFLVIEKDVDMCGIGWKQFCPLYPGALQVDSVQYISSEYTRQIPGIAYQVPDIDAVVKVVVKDKDTGVQVSCIQSSFTNGKTISQTGVKWATAVVAGLGLLIAAILSTFGNSYAASHISANAVSLFLYFQSVVLVSMQAVERVPPIASAWSENLAWSMGLIEIKFMQKIFRWYIQSTGGSPTTYFLGVTKQILVQKRKRSLEYVEGLGKRALDFGLRSNTNLIVLRGIKRIGFNSHIEPTSIVATGYTWTMLIGYLLVGILIFSKSIAFLLTRSKKMNPRIFTIFRAGFHNVVKGSLLRYIYIASTQLILFSLWEFTQVDSAAVVVLSVLFLILLIAVLGWSFFNVIRVGIQSTRDYKNPAAKLYGDSKVLEKWGFCYTMFHADKYWFGTVLLGYNVFKVVFIAFCQGGAGKVSVWPVFIADLFYTIFLIWKAPYLNNLTNVINYMISVVSTINSFLFLFFSDIFGQKAPVASIMGWIFFILNAAFSLILLIMIVVLMLFSIFTKNPDARFAPTKDDRFSFQRKFSIRNKNKNQMYEEKSGPVHSSMGAGAEELAALSMAAQDHSQDWEAQMYKLNELSQDNSDIPAPLQEGYVVSPNRNDNNKEIMDSSSLSSSTEKSACEPKRKQSLGTKWKNVIANRLTMGEKNQQKDSGQEHDGKNTRMSDTLVDTGYKDEDFEDDKGEATNLRNATSNANNNDSNPYLRPTHFNRGEEENPGYANMTNQIHKRNESFISELSGKNPTNTKDFL
ncbi:FLC1 [Candida oxycetoniae]|uniref:FLC1 n=1 Tax=Candida oxycetoniae TaxID=497107 RepID=A0AAI9SVR2_9ASCO|nr:FLC1 [Candida oxycetoniae]KAI3403968.2 FLC1 [Candida oxycetoniae]